MFSESRWKRVTFLIAAFFVQCVCGTDTPTALSVTPSTTWIGDDGDWSPISMRVGTPAQWLYLLVSTASSETWVMGTGGCDTSTLCYNDRGGLFNESYSETWVPEGFYNLGLDTQLGFGGYGDYGLDVLTFGTTGVSLTDAIIATVNTTEYWVGFFGLGIVPGNFTDITALSGISGLVETEGAIPSHSYGYTAGASYQLKGVPVSLTLGGYDENRLESHNTTFELNPSQQPEVYIDSISVMSSNSSSNWTTEVSLLSTTDRVYATIDSSTPYLWLPASVCERFASSLGLTYNTSLELYTFDSDPSQHSVLESADLTFTFNLSDTSASDDIVTITLPYAAFDLQLSYPFIPNTTYGSAEATKYYFPLRQASGANQYTIGRAFLQEAYIITDYERNNFSVHQAVHTEDPIANTSLVDIPRYDYTTFSDLPVDNSPAGLQTGAIVGIVVGCLVAVTLIALLVFWLRSRRQRKDAADDEKDSGSSTPGSRSNASGANPSSSPRTFLGRLLRRQKDPVAVHEAAGNSSYRTEMATESHERYELPATLPAELHSESNTLSGTAENSSPQGTPNLSAYEVARRKLERQQAAERGLGPYLPENTQSEFSHLVHYYAPESLSDGPSPLSSPLPSPLPSHVGHGSHGQSSSDIGGSAPSPISPAFRPLSTATGPPNSPPPEYRRTPNNALYAGPIPADVQLPEHVPHVVDSRDGTTLGMGMHPASSTLGSHYTENEMDSIGNIYDEDSIEVSHDTASEHDSRRPNARGPNWPLDEEEGTRIIGGRVVREEDESKFRMEDVQALRSEIQLREAEDPYRNRRRLDGEDLVHVPIPAQNRFSFESNRSGEGRGTMI